MAHKGCGCGSGCGCAPCRARAAASDSSAPVQRVSGRSYRAGYADRGRGVSYRNLQRGMRGPDVSALQRSLADAGLMDRSNIDGIFGPQTEAAVRRYQQARSLTVDGIVGPRTSSALAREGRPINGANGADGQPGANGTGGALPTTRAEDRSSSSSSTPLDDLTPGGLGSSAADALLNAARGSGGGASTASGAGSSGAALPMNGACDPISYAWARARGLL